MPQLKSILMFGYTSLSLVANIKHFEFVSVQIQFVISVLGIKVGW